MKRLLCYAATLTLISSCNNSNEKVNAVNSDSTVKNDQAATTAQPASYDYPYTLESAYSDWQPGDQQHAANTMKSLRAYEMNDIPAAVNYFGDSVEFRFDGFEKTVAHDSIAAILTGSRNAYPKYSIQMRDWESVISKDKKEEWVTLWYKQIWTDKNGKTDSAAVVNDAKIKNGKIVLLEETMRKFATKK